MGRRLHRKGEPKWKGVYEDSGFHIDVSEAGFDQFERQIQDAIEFLDEEHSAIQVLAKADGIEQAFLDIGIAQRDHPGVFHNFPSRPVKLAGHAGLGLMISEYRVSGMGGYGGEEGETPES